MVSSTHKCEVVRIDECHPIPGADRIVRVDVFGGYPCVIRKEDWAPGRLWCYIPPDSLVPVSRPEFKFLDAPGNGVRADRTVRIKTRKYKKQESFGLLIPCPKLDAKEGDDLAGTLEVKHWQPDTKPQPVPLTKMEKLARLITGRSFRYGEKPPGISAPYYDIEQLRRHPSVFEGRMVHVTEKIHGSNVCFAWKPRGFWHRLLRPGREQNLRVRSRTVWKPPHDNSYHCRCVTKEIKRFLEHEGDTHVLYGEVYGPGVQKGFGYGVTKPTFVAFDIWSLRYHAWASFHRFVELCDLYDIPMAPVLYQGKYDFDKITELSEGRTVLGRGVHVREGVVVHCDDAPFRKLKCVGTGYYEATMVEDFAF